VTPAGTWVCRPTSPASMYGCNSTLTPHSTMQNIRRYCKWRADVLACRCHPGVSVCQRVGHDCLSYLNEILEQGKYQEGYGLALRASTILSQPIGQGHLWGTVVSVGREQDKLNIGRRVLATGTLPFSNGRVKSRTAVGWPIRSFSAVTFFGRVLVHERLPRSTGPFGDKIAS
jgi:hypothetical protein